MNLLGVYINGILDTKNMHPVSNELLAAHSINLDVMAYRKNLIESTSLYHGLVVGSDWNANAALVESFKKAGKKTILLQSEGMFLNQDHWYRGRAPATHLACVWGPIHREIFISRGYSGECAVTGPPRFDLYSDFKPSVSREELYSILGLPDLSKGYVLFLCQFFPSHEWGEELLVEQLQFTRFAASPVQGHYSLIKIHPQEPAESFTKKRDLIVGAGNADAIVIGHGSHSEPVDVSTLVYHSSGVISYSSTVLFEAALLGKPIAIFFDHVSSPLSDGRLASLPRVGSASDVISLLRHPPAAEALERFLGVFVPKRIDGQFTRRAASTIASFMQGSLESKVQVAVSRPQRHSETIAESDRQVSDIEAYRRATIAAYADAASQIAGMTPVDRAIALKGSLRPARQTVTHDHAYYQALHERDIGYKTNNWLISEFDKIAAAQPRKLLEIGCGNGRFLAAAAEVIPEVIGLDFAKSPELEKMPPNVSFQQADLLTCELPQVDLVCSADVLEHFPFEQLSHIAGKLSSAGRLQYHVIACYDDGHSHLSIMPPSSWLAVFKDYCHDIRLMDVRPRRQSPNQLVCVLGNF